MTRASWLGMLTLLAAGAVAGCGDDAQQPTGGGAVSYEALTVKDPQQSAAFIAVEDLDGDGKREIVLSTLLERTPPGPPNPLSRGALRIFSTAGDAAGPWSERVVISASELGGYPFINTPQVFDVDGDGHRDLLVQTGFLSTLGGTQFWMPGPDFSERRNFAPQTTRYLTGYFWHEAGQADLDGDGLLDIVSTSAQTQDLIGNPTNPLGSPDGNEKLRVEWYRHLGGGEFAYHEIATGVGGVFLKLHDVDRDGDVDIILSQFFGPPAVPAVVWLEQLERPSEANDYQGVWQQHAIDSTIGYGYHMEVVDLNGDGRTDLVVGAHNHQDNEALVDPDGQRVLPGLYWFEIPDEPQASSQWTRHVISQNFRVTLAGSVRAQGVPGIFSVGDLDGDGRLDLAVPGDGNDLLYAFRQRADGSFVEDIVDSGKKMF
ncbi:MAG TPA: VCBS repeat-containing protein, partial [Fontimonas sp.]